MKQSVKLVVMFMALAAISSCVDLNWDEKKQENANNSFFAKMVGRIDPDHTWNLAKEGSVTVSTASPSEIRIFSVENGRNKLVATKSVDGKQKITFDVTYGVSKVYVEDRNTGAVRKIDLGSSVSFAGTRSYGSGNSKVSVSQTKDYLYYNYATVQKDVNTAAFTSPDSATQLFLSNNTFTLYPVWFTSESGCNQEFGLYYYENGQRVEVMLYKNDKQEESYQFFPNWNNPNDYAQDWAWQTYFDAHMSSMENQINTNIENNVRIKGFQVNVADGLEFGFYIKGDDQGVKYYSEDIPYDFNGSWVEANLDGFYRQNGYDGTQYFGHFAIINENGHSYLACDNNCEVRRNAGNKMGPEYYHLVFEIGNQFGTPVTPEESKSYITGSDDPVVPPVDPDDDDDDDIIIPAPEEGSWIIACEDVFPGSDINGSCDYDFNDVVLKVTHVEGNPNISITFLAAGSTLGNSVYFGNENLGEIHAILGHSEKIKGKNGKEAYQMINTSTKGLIAETVTITKPVPEGFSMSKNMGGFRIVRDGNVQSVVEAPKKGCVPYMICVPGDWKWCVENQAIFSTYSQFGGWSNDHNTNVDWYANCSNASQVFSFPANN